jgi:type II secretory pathway component PulM
VGIAILLWLVELAVLWFGVAATEKKIAAGDAGAEARMPMFTGISHLLLLVLVYLMVFKPGL